MEECIREVKLAQKPDNVATAEGMPWVTGVVQGVVREEE